MVLNSSLKNSHQTAKCYSCSHQQTSWLILWPFSHFFCSFHFSGTFPCSSFSNGVLPSLFLLLTNFATFFWLSLIRQYWQEARGQWDRSRPVSCRFYLFFYLGAYGPADWRLELFHLPTFHPNKQLSVDYTRSSLYCVISETSGVGTDSCCNSHLYTPHAAISTDLEWPQSRSAHYQLPYCKQPGLNYSTRPQAAMLNYPSW